MWVVMLWSRVEFSRVAPVAVTVTATLSGSSGIELEHMEQAATPADSPTGNGPEDSCRHDGKSRVTGDCHARFRGSRRVRFPPATRLEPGVGFRAVNERD